MKMLVISPCSSTQKHSELPNRLEPADFTSSERLARRIKELDKYKEPAAEMYEGREHEEIMEGLRKIRNCYGREVVDLSIISTGYGLIDECCTIVPYDVPNNTSPVLNGVGRGKLHQDVEKLIKDYDLVFFLLGETYVRALQLPFNVPDTVTQVFLIFTRTTGYRSLIPECLQNCEAIELHAHEFRSGYTAKGLVFKKLCEAACRDGFQVFEQVKQDPQRLLEIVRR
ncbi:hypothetical protein F4Z99_19075 [Candidatus Poribacteria bacterium]|nr:hypothetical protein [Candidatus Poribacteria bacterium]MYA98887.1 hypothetical protein [Candidatus Poribacteria bacterium]